MPAFQRRSLNPLFQFCVLLFAHVRILFHGKAILSLVGWNRVGLTVKKHPFLLFGLPFLTVMVGGSFVLANLTQTRYDLTDDKVKSLSRSQELGMRKDRRKIDVREEYFRLQSAGELGDEQWENVRVPRLPGQAEWGEMPELPIAKKKT